MLKHRSYQQFTRLLAGLLFFVSIYPYVAHACEMAGMASGHEQGVCCCAEAVNREAQQNETSHHGHHEVEDQPVDHGHHGGDGSSGMDAAHHPSQHRHATVQHIQHPEHTVPCDEHGIVSLDDQTLRFEGDACCNTVAQPAEVEAIVRYKASFLPEVSVAIRYADEWSSLASLVPARVNVIFKGISYPATTRLYLTFRSFLN